MRYEDQWSKAMAAWVARFPCSISFTLSANEEWHAHRVDERFGPIDAMINNAGLDASSRDDLEDVTLAKWNRNFDVNVGGVFLGTKFAIRVGRSLRGISLYAFLSGVLMFPLKPTVNEEKPQPGIQIHRQHRLHRRRRRRSRHRICSLLLLERRRQDLHQIECNVLLPQRLQHPGQLCPPWVLSLPTLCSNPNSQPLL